MTDKPKKNCKAIKIMCSNGSVWETFMGDRNTNRIQPKCIPGYDGYGIKS